MALRAGTTIYGVRVVTAFMKATQGAVRKEE